MTTVVGFLVLAALLTAALQVDDWSRDFTTNQATTSSDAEDLMLRSFQTSATLEQVQTKLSEFISQSSAWSYRSGDAGDRSAEEIALVHRSRFLGFKDDVRVFLNPTDQGVQIDAASQSRIGKGDLGQNPRNLRELMATLRAALPASG